MINEIQPKIKFQNIVQCPFKCQNVIIYSPKNTHSKEVESFVTGSFTQVGSQTDSMWHKGFCLPTTTKASFIWHRYIVDFGCPVDNLKMQE